MKDEEKNLIENLFERLKKTELNSSERDTSADILIQSLVKKQPASSYYMAQTILIQETAIKKMSSQIEELNKKIKILNTEDKNKKPSFLSNFFKKNPSSQAISHNNSIWKNEENTVLSHRPNPAVVQTNQALPIVTRSSSSSGFLSSALQTATGVAGGMILGNMLMNVFNHTKPEEEIFDNVNQSSLDQHTENNLLNHDTNHNTNNDLNNNLVNYNSNQSDDETQCSSENIHNDFCNEDEIDMNDDNFI